MCSCPSRDVCQTIRDACFSWVLEEDGGERQEQLGVVCITVVRESMNPCDVIAEPSDVVYSENRSGPNTEPWGTPFSRKQGLDKVPCVPEKCDLLGLMWTRLEQSQQCQVQPEWRGGFGGWLCQMLRINRGQWALMSWTRLRWHRVTQSLWGGPSQWSDHSWSLTDLGQGGCFWKIGGHLAVDGMFKGFREEWKKVCNFGCQLRLGWVSLGVASLWLSCLKKSEEMKHTI